MDQTILVDAGGRLMLGRIAAADGAMAEDDDLSDVGVKLYHPGDANDTDDPLQDWTAASVSEDGEIYYDISAALADEIGENYRAQWRYTLDGRTHYRDQLFHITQTQFAPTYTSAELELEESWLSTFTTITAAQKQNAILRAYDDIWLMLKGSGRLPWLIFNQNDINRCVHYRAMEKICIGEMREDGDHWHTRAAVYHERFQQLWKAMPLTYSNTDRGTPEDTQGWIEIESERV